MVNWNFIHEKTLNWKRIPEKDSEFEVHWKWYPEMDSTLKVDSRSRLWIIRESSVKKGNSKWIHEIETGFGVTSQRK